MNGIFALGHFCESHGPSVILCTQSLTELHREQPPHILTVPWCNACKSIELNHAYLSKYEASNYVSVRTALKQELAFLLKQACVRSLSCEEETGKDGGTVYFGDSERGHVLSYTFRLPDSLARGFHRLFTIILLMRDKVHLLNSWPFVTTHLKKLIDHLQVHSLEINRKEQNECSQRSLRVATGQPGQPRSLIELTGIEKVFAQIHLWFAWILIAASKETSENNRLEDFSPWINEKEVDGFSLVEFNKNNQKGEKTEGKGKYLREILQKLGEHKFKVVSYCILVGNQLIVRGPQLEVSKILNALSILLPQKWLRLTSYSTEYINADICNFFGCGLNVAVPQPNDEIVRIDIVNDEYHLKWNGELPEKIPTLLTKIMKSLQNNLVQDEVLDTQINVFVEEWVNNAQSLYWAQQNQQTDEKLGSLLQALGVQLNDNTLIKHWIKQVAQF